MTEVNIFSNKTWDLSFLTSQQKCGQTPLQGTCHCCGVWENTTEREREMGLCGTGCPFEIFTAGF